MSRRPWWQRALEAAPWHPRAALLLDAEGRLADAQRARVERHLARCASCRARSERLRATIARLRAWPVDERGAPPLPALRVDASRPPSRFASWSASGTASMPARAARLAVLLAAAVVAVAGLAWLGADRLDLVAAQGEPSAFEALALARHAALRTTRPDLEFPAGDAGAIRDWLRQRGGFQAALAGERASGAVAVRWLGAATAGPGGGAAAPRAAAVVARIGDERHPVTLLVGHADEVPELPGWSLLAKELLVRRDPGTGTHLLSWKNAGKAYTLVTEDPLDPRLACQLCHTEPGRLRAIDRIASQL